MWENINCGDFINYGRLSSLLWVVLNAISFLVFDFWFFTLSEIEQHALEQHSPWAPWYHLFIKWIFHKISLIYLCELNWQGCYLWKASSDKFMNFFYLKACMFGSFEKELPLVQALGSRGDRFSYWLIPIEAIWFLICWQYYCSW